MTDWRRDSLIYILVALLGFCASGPGGVILWVLIACVIVMKSNNYFKERNKNESLELQYFHWSLANNYCRDSSRRYKGKSYRITKQEVA